MDAALKFANVSPTNASTLQQYRNIIATLTKKAAWIKHVHKKFVSMCDISGIIMANAVQETAVS